MHVKYLIVGQGLAGTVLSYQLLSRGKKVVVVDSDELRSSSHVAAGIFNPITGRKLVKTWMANEIFPYMTVFYKKLEDFLGEKFFYEIPIYRPFFSIQQQNEWMGLSADENMNCFIKAICPNNTYSDYIHDPYGGLELKSCGYVDIATLLSSYRNYLRQIDALIEDKFTVEKFNNGDLSAITFGTECITADFIIYCNGPIAEGGNKFSWLPFRKVKGEIVIIEPEIPLPVIFNKGIFILPVKEGKCKAGATYDRNDDSWDTTKKGREDLLTKLDSLMKKKYKIIDQTAGIRPATLDRKPFIGVHPQDERSLIFNGFGTKGVSMVPYFSDKFCNFLLNKKELPVEVNINRYFSLY